MAQCSLLTLQKALVNAGTSLVGFLRGQTGTSGASAPDRDRSG